MSENLILKNLDQPQILEEAYRKSPGRFESQFEEAISQSGESETLRVWQARLNYLPSVAVKKSSVIFLISLCLMSSFLTKIPSFFGIDKDWYYSRFPPLIVAAAIIIYFLNTATSNLKIKKFIMSAIVGCIAYLLILPEIPGSASIKMTLIHMPLIYLSLLAVSFMSNNWKNVEARLDFIRYIGEMGIYTALILLGGMVLTGITFGLFGAIDLHIEQWYLEYIVVFGLVSSPLVATYLFDSIQNRQSRFAPILSNVFSPLFLVTVLAYLAATFYQGKSPFTDRDFLITFNGLLLVILALTIFSISGKKKAVGIQASDYINVSLISATLIVNIIALSAILFRWVEYGVTVNRIVVTGANILIFVHLALLLFQYIKHLRECMGIENLKSTIARYLPVYTAWSLFVSVVVPLGFKFE